MKNNLRLYKSTLKRLAIPAVIMGALLIISTVLYLTGNAPQDTYYYGYGSFFRGMPTAFAMAPGLPIFMILGSALMTYMAFSYLNKRSASDFYHALPYTRTENFIARFGAVMTYQVGVTFITLVTSLLVLLSNGTPFHAQYLPLLFLGYTAGSLAVAGGVALGMSLTGTLVSNVLVSGIILFLPRMILFIFGQSVANMVSRRILLGHTGILLNPSYNIVTGSLLDISRIWEYYGLSETLINPGSIIYTLVLGAIYVALALLMMRKRKSELAGNGAKSLAWACVYSALASLPILLFGVVNFSHTGFRNISRSSMMTVLIIAVIALVVFIVLSFVLSKRWKSMARALPMFAAIVVIAIGVVFGAQITAEKMGTALPDKSNIAYVRVTEQGDWEYRYKSVYNYNTLLGSQVKFTDAEVIELFHDTLAENNRTWLDQHNGIYDSGYDETTRVLCEFKLLNGRSIYRRVNVPVQDIADFREAMMKNQAYVNAYTALAEDAQIHFYKEDVEELYESTWEVYKTEFNSLSQSEKINLNLNYSYQGIIGYSRTGWSEDRGVLNTIVYGELGETPYTQSMTVSYATPKTADFYMNAVNAQVKDVLNARLNEAFNLPDDSMFDLSFRILSDSGTGTRRFYNSYASEEEREYSPDLLTDDQLREVIDIIVSKDLSSVSIGDSLMLVQFSIFNRYEDNDQYYEAFVPLTESEVSTLISFYND